MDHLQRQHGLELCLTRLNRSMQNSRLSTNWKLQLPKDVFDRDRAENSCPASLEMCWEKPL